MVLLLKEKVLSLSICEESSTGFTLEVSMLEMVFWKKKGRQRRKWRRVLIYIYMREFLFTCLRLAIAIGEY